MLKRELWETRVLALAGMVQASKLVQQLARQGKADEKALSHSIQSILILKSSDPLETLHGAKGMRLGLKEIPKLFGKKTQKNGPELIRYLISLYHLQKKLEVRNDLKKTLKRRILQAQSQATHFNLTHQHVIDTLASGFLQTLGQFKYRIEIVGGVNHLKKTEILAAIRTCLLTGIHAASLWRQAGGNRWQLLFFRKRIIRVAENLLKSSSRKKSAPSGTH